MKTAAKVFIILDIVYSSVFILWRDLFNSLFPDFPFGLLYLIISIIIDAVALGKLENATKKSDLTVVGILSIIFCNVLGGVFMLCINERTLHENYLKLKAKKENAADNWKIKDPPDITTNADEYFEELSDLKYLYDNGLITEEEYKEKRDKYKDLL